MYGPLISFVLGFDYILSILFLKYSCDKMSSHFISLLSFEYCYSIDNDLFLFVRKMITILTNLCDILNLVLWECFIIFNFTNAAIDNIFYDILS